MTLKLWRQTSAVCLRKSFKFNTVVDNLNFLIDYRIGYRASMEYIRGSFNFYKLILLTGYSCSVMSLE